MNRIILDDEEIRLEPGVKSLVPSVKSTLALAVLLWECAGCPAKLRYSKQYKDKIVMTEELSQWVIDHLSEICHEEQIADEMLIAVINENPLFQSPIEVLITMFESVWKLAKVTFVEKSYPINIERAGEIRYLKKLEYSVNIDIIHSVIESNPDAFLRVLMSWMGFHINIMPECEVILKHLFTALSEGAIFQITDGGRDIVFYQNSLYDKALKTQQAVEVNKADKEESDSARILKWMLADDMNPYLKYGNGGVTATERKTGDLKAYQQRVTTFLNLSIQHESKLEEIEKERKQKKVRHLEKTRIAGGSNVLLYGVPGAGKSWTIAHEYCNDESRMERLVFHPDYTYSDFIGQILPEVSEGKVSYAFKPGPFTSLLKRAYWNPNTEYFLIIEEINRGNAPAIFGDVFQLLDRKMEFNGNENNGYPVGTSEYGITNANIAQIVYGNPEHKVRIPSNLSIIGTMNTSDQNVFTLDTAFQRRWEMRMIENSFVHVDKTFADHPILDTHVTWRIFCTVMNQIILEKNVRLASSEDKRLGVYFVHLRDLIYDERADDQEADALEQAKAKRNNSRFPEKVLKYLWDDVFKFSRDDIFEVDQYNSLEAVIRKFMEEQGDARFSILKDTIYNALIKPGTQKN